MAKLETALKICHAPAWRATFYSFLWGAGQALHEAELLYLSIVQLKIGNCCMWQTENNALPHTQGKGNGILASSTFDKLHLRLFLKPPSRAASLSGTNPLLLMSLCSP